MNDSLTYAASGVDIDKANKLVSRIKDIAKTTPRTGVMGEIGGFGGLYSLNLANVSNPVLVSSTDGVGTKLKIAFMMDKHDTIGIDLVAMCVNDVIVGGAEPLFFLDYFATGKLNADVGAAVVSGIAEGCFQAGCALVGGETAEMPDFYEAGEYDLAGFSVGVVDRTKIIDGTKIKEGDCIIGIPSTGVHSNGFSLVRKIVFNKMGLSTGDMIDELGLTVAQEFLKPTRIYVKEILELIKKFEIRGMVHITGGGFYENIPRVIPAGLGARIDGDFPVLPVFKWMKNCAELSQREMFTTFNCGTGFMLIVPEDQVEELLKNSDRYYVGKIVRTDEPERVKIVKNYF